MWCHCPGLCHVQYQTAPAAQWQKAFQDVYATGQADVALMHNGQECDAQQDCYDVNLLITSCSTASLNALCPEAHTQLSTIERGVCDEAVGDAIKQHQCSGYYMPIKSQTASTHQLAKQLSSCAK